MSGSEQYYTVYAVKVVQHNEEAAKYWVPILYKEMKAGRARFGWGGAWEGLDPVKGADLRYLKGKIDAHGWEALSDEEKSVYSHASFLLDVQPGDYFVYINMPEWGMCSIVKITGEYIFDDKPFDPVKWDDFRHQLPCEFVATFDRNANYVHPYLQRRLKLQGAWYRIYAQREFKDLLSALQTGDKGKTPEERLGEVVASSLQSIACEAYRHFPEKNLERLARHLLSRHQYIRNVRKGPDVNGADLEMELEIPLGPSSLRFLCAVQVKSYEGTMGYQRAIDDIRRAFNSNPEYTCGLIVSTALDYTKEFEKELEKVRAEFNKPVEVLLGKDIAYMLVLDHMDNQAETH